MCALPRESRSLTGKALAVGACESRGEAWVTVTGMGAAAAVQGARRLLDRGARGLVSWGTCGGLDPRLRAGDVVVAASVVDSGGRSYAVDEALSAAIHRLVGGRPQARGFIVSMDTVIATTHAKRELSRRSAAVAVDMESGAIAAFAAEQNVPFVAVRAIVDAAGTTLPRAVMQAVDERGDIRWRVFLRALGLRYTAWAEIVTLMRHAHKAERALAVLARRIAVTE